MYAAKFENFIASQTKLFSKNQRLLSCSVDCTESTDSVIIVAICMKEVDLD